MAEDHHEHPVFDSAGAQEPLPETAAGDQPEGRVNERWNGAVHGERAAQVGAARAVAHVKDMDLMTRPA